MTSNYSTPLQGWWKLRAAAWANLYRQCYPMAKIAKQYDVSTATVKAVIQQFAKEVGGWMIVPIVKIEDLKELPAKTWYWPISDCPTDEKARLVMSKRPWVPSIGYRFMDTVFFVRED